MSAFKKLPITDRPRERLVRYGAEVLSSIELLAILIGSGTKDRTVLELATDVLSSLGPLQKLNCASVEEISSIKGIGLAKAIQLKAAFALQARLQDETRVRLPLFEAAQIASLIEEELISHESEALMVILRDVKRQIFHRQIIAIGTLTEVLLHPREVFFPAIRHKAHSVMIAHNHPSGDPEPSLPDIEMTEALKEAGKTLGIPVADHLIIGRKTYFSFLERGIL